MLFVTVHAAVSRHPHMSAMLSHHGAVHPLMVAHHRRVMGRRQRHENQNADDGRELGS